MTALRDRAAHLAPYRWPKGVSGNPTGRPKDAKQRLSFDFLAALHRDFQEHGADAIARCREGRPDVYLRVVAAVLPRELHMRTSPLDDLEPEQLLRLADTLQAAIDAAKAGLPVPPIVLEGGSDA